MPELEEEIEQEEKKEKPSAGAEQQLEETNKRIKELEERLDAETKEKKGIYGDLKKEQEKRKQLEASLEERERKIQREEDDDIFAEMGDEDFITGKHLKKFNQAVTAREKKRIVQELQSRADERLANDEHRMMELCESGSEKFPVSYDEAIEAFKELAEDDPTIWRQFDAEKYRPGGRPALLAYKIAVREHKKFQEETKRKTREQLLNDMEEKEKKPAKLKGGAGGAAKRLDEMSDEEISGLSDEELDRLARSK